MLPLSPMQACMVSMIAARFIPRALHQVDFRKLIRLIIDPISPLPLFKRENKMKNLKTVYAAITVCCLAACKPAPPPEEAAPDPAAGTTRVNPADGQIYVWIPAGKFTMGCSPNDRECDPKDEPVQAEEFPYGYWMGQTPVTVRAWKKYRVAKGEKALPTSDQLTPVKLNEANRDDNMPAVMMDWSAAKQFCDWAGGGLPADELWEYAARAGSTAARYGNLDDIAWYADNSGKRRISSQALLEKNSLKYGASLRANDDGPHPVARKAPNAWNLYDMLGNVTEWVENSHASVDNRSISVSEQPGERGCSWFDPETKCRASARDAGGEWMHFIYYSTRGFRCEMGGETGKKWPAVH